MKWFWSLSLLAFSAALAYAVGDSVFALVLGALGSAPLAYFLFLSPQKETK